MELFSFCPAVVSALEGKDCREAMRSIAETTVIPQERLSHIIAGMHRVLSEATRIPAALLKQEVRCCLNTRMSSSFWFICMFNVY